MVNRKPRVLVEQSAGELLINVCNDAFRGVGTLFVFSFFIGRYNMTCNCACSNTAVLFRCPFSLMASYLKAICHNIKFMNDQLSSDFELQYKKLLICLHVSHG